jgi:mannose-6-phosphate isomerase-like protein (cupin superfamily)
MISELFENIKIYGRYVNKNKLNGIEYWNKIKFFIQRPEQKIGLEELEKIFEKKWDISVKTIDSPLPIIDLQKIYEYVHKDLSVHGEEGDEEIYSLKHNIWEKNHFFLQTIRIPYKNNEFNLLRLLQIAYNLGQLSINFESYDEYQKYYYTTNNLDNINSYKKISPIQNTQINTNIQIKDLINNLNFYIIFQMNNVQSGGAEVESFYSDNIEKLTKENNDYRRVIYTGNNQQFVLMSIQPKKNIPMEIHKHNDQFIRIEEGEGKAIIGSTTYILKEDSGVIIPAGMKHEIINTSESSPLKLYTIYSPPEHQDKLVQKNNPEKITNSDIDFDSTEIIKKELTKLQTGGLKINKKESDYKIKYNEYKNKYLDLKNFMKKYY